MSNITISELVPESVSYLNDLAETEMTATGGIDDIFFNGDVGVAVVGEDVDFDDIDFDDINF